MHCSFIFNNTSGKIFFKFTFILLQLLNLLSLKTVNNPTQYSMNVTSLLGLQKRINGCFKLHY